LKARHLTPSVCPSNTCKGMPVAATQIRTVLSELAEAKTSSFGEKSTHQTCASCARKVTLSSGGSCRRSHMCTLESANAAASTIVFSARSNDHTGLVTSSSSRNLSNLASLW